MPRTKYSWEDDHPPQRRRRSWWKWLLLLPLLLAVLGAAIGAVVLFSVRSEFTGLAGQYDLERLERMESASSIYDRKGGLMGKIFIQNRSPVAYDKISPLLVKAVVAAEDQRFWSHDGIDYFGILRAAQANWTAGRIRQGASTVTQQLARNSFDLKERTYRRKLLEMALALRIEEKFPKEKIMEMYLNRVYFGGGLYGAESAARGYFGVPAAELTAAQSAVLAGLLKSPNSLSPWSDPEAAKACGIFSYDDAVNATRYNNEYWISNRYGDTRILNVLQGSNHAEADHWYDLMKGYSDPNQYPNRHFNGWGMGGQNMCDVHLVLKRLVNLIHDGLLEKGVHDWMHFLGTSKLEWAVLLTDIQRAVRQYANPNFTISFDCASPFLATANGQLYHNILCENRSKWSYQMSPTADDKKYATDNRLLRDAVLQDGIHDQFESSPVSARLRIRDVCVYQPGELNKIGKEGRTSWDSFSYALMMAHNVWMHIESVQRANRRYDQGICPDMMVHPTDSDYDVRTVIDRVFAARDRSKSLSIIDDHAKIWERVIGTRGYTGRRAVSARPQFLNLFDVEQQEPATDQDLDTNKLEELESSI